MNHLTQLIGFICLLGFIGLAGCSENKSDEALILEKIDQLQQTIENHERGRFMEVIDASYQDQLNPDRKALQRMLLGFFLRYKDISVFVSANEVEVNQIRAEVHSQVVVTGGRGLIPDDARHYQVVSCWNKVSDDWYLSCLEWE